MAPHSSTLAWKIPRAEKPGGLQSRGLLRVGHDWVISLWLLTFMHWRRKWQSIQCSCLENPKDGRAWWAAVYGVAWSRTRLKQLSSSSSHTSYCQDFLKSQHFSKCVHGSNYGFNLNFLVINDVDYVFIVATHVSSLMTCLFRYFTLFGFFLDLLGGLWNLSSPTKDWIWATAVKVWHPNQNSLYFTQFLIGLFCYWLWRALYIFWIGGHF